jgi:MFS family permease
MRPNQQLFSALNGRLLDNILTLWYNFANKGGVFMAKKLWNRDFILLLQANAVSTIGDLMYSVAIGYWVYEKTGSSGLMGIMSAISMFVTMFLSPFSGSIVDKCSRKWVMVAMDTLQGVLMLTVGVFAYLDRLAVPGVLAAAFLAALGSVFYSPAVSTLMIDIIPRDDMVRGQSIHSGLMSMIDMVGTAFSGAMVAFFGVPLIVVLNGLSNLYSALSELFIRVPRTVRQGEKVTVKGILKDSRRAVGDIFSNRFLRLFVPCALLINLMSAGPLALMLPFCLEKGFAVEQYGYLMAVGSAAYASCVILLGIVKLKPKARFWLMSVGFIASSVFIIFGYLSIRFLFVCIWAFGFMFLNAAGNTIFNASMMLALPEENRGAILGFIRSASVGGTALSAVIYGFLGDVFPLYLVFTVGSALSLVPMIRLCFDKRTREFVLTH